MIAGVYEPFAGTIAVTLAIIGGLRLGPPTGYMGGKRSLTGAILGAAGVVPGEGAERIVVSDVGPWGDFWTVIAAGDGHAVANVLRSWRSEDPRRLWDRLADLPPMEDPVERAAQFVWLQARSASCTPIWWEGGTLVAQSGARDGAGVPASQCGGRWLMPTGSRNGTRRGGLYAATQKEAIQRDNGREKRACGGVLNVRTVANRIDAIADAFARRRGAPIEVVHDDVGVGFARLPQDLTGWVAFVDPPYEKATRYAGLCSRARAVGIAATAADRGARTLVSESVALPELTCEGWPTMDITHARIGARSPKPEWLTMNREPAHRVATQQRMFGG